MTDLTEKWKNGELPDGFYYFKLPDGSTDIASEYKMIRYRLTKDADKVEVLAPVPSYDEWQKVLNIDFTNEVLRLENAKLKELLYSLKCCLTSQNIEPQIRVEKSLAKIDNAIGEKK